MYVPPEFAVTDRDVLYDVIRRHNFGILFGRVDGAPYATHLPFLLAGDCLVAHMARANPHWRSFAEGEEALVVFSGPHAYISPSWYAGGRNVPTWNYVAVHAYGVPRVVEDPERCLELQRALVDAHEAGFAAPWRLADVDGRYVAGRMTGIVNFEIPIARLEGKCKMNQNKTAADRAAVVRALGASGDANDRAVAALIPTDG